MTKNIENNVLLVWQLWENGHLTLNTIYMEFTDQITIIFYDIAENSRDIARVYSSLVV